MQEFDPLRNFNKIFEQINRLANPLGNFYTVYHNNSTLDYLKKLEVNTPYNLPFYNIDVLSCHNSMNRALERISENLYPKSLTEIFEKIYNNDHWSNLAKISVLYNLETVVEDENIEEFISEFNDNIETINSNVEEFDENLIYHINNFLIGFRAYLKENPIANISFYVFQSLLLTYIGSVLFSTTETNINIDNSITINQVIEDKVFAKVNTDSLYLKSFARDNSKKVGCLLKNTEVEVLKDNIKWAFVIEKNTTNTGWVRKESLSFIK